MRRILKIIGIAVGALIVLGIILAIVDPSKKSATGNTGTTTTVAAQAATTVPATTVPTTTTVPAPTTTEAPTTTVPAIVTVQSQSGSGISSLPEFTIPADATGWYLGWNYNCSGFGSSGNFIVSVNGLGGTQTTDAGTNQLGASGSSVENYYDTGTFQLSVNSECNWAVKVTYSN